MTNEHLGNPARFATDNVVDDDDAFDAHLREAMLQTQPSNPLWTASPAKKVYRLAGLRLGILLLALSLVALCVANLMCPPSAETMFGYDGTAASSSSYVPPPSSSFVLPPPIAPPRDAAVTTPPGPVATLSLGTRPYAEAIIDGRRYGQTPFFGPRQLSLSIGRHTLELHDKATSRATTSSSPSMAKTPTTRSSSSSAATSRPR